MQLRGFHLRQVGLLIQKMTQETHDFRKEIRVLVVGFRFRA